MRPDRKRSGVLRVIGTMSGTSLDGVDAATIETDGVEILNFGRSSFRPYTQEERAVLSEALGTWPGDTAAVQAAAVVDDVHAVLLGELLDGSEGGEVSLVGFHGQTLAHDPATLRTHQAGDGDVLAQRLGLPVVWDFRSSDVELGGQGAPLAPAYHHALARYLRFEEPVAFLNLGGVGNLTWTDPAKERPDDPGALLAFDTGPANAPLNDHVLGWLGEPHDRDGVLASEGAVNDKVIESFLRHAYFQRMPPKSLDRNDFTDLAAAVDGLSASEGAATLTAAVAVSVMRGVEHFPSPVSRILVTGGGRKNPVMMRMISEAVDAKVAPVEDFGLDGDMLEAQAFGFLAVRVLRGMPTSFPGTTGVSAAVGGGRVSRPS